MSGETQFRRLIREQITGLFDAYAQTLRLSYIEVLTLLQDILGRYSSNGNPTVFFHSSDAENHIYERLKQLRTFEVTEPESEFFQAPRFTAAVEDTKEPWRDVTVLIKTEATAEKWMSRVRKKRGLRETDGERQFPLGTFRGLDLEEASLIKLYGDSVDYGDLDYTVDFLVNEVAGVLVVYGQQYKIKQFTLLEFKRALGLIDNRFNNAQEAYKDLMKEVKPQRKNLREMSQRKFVEDLKRAVLESASQNVTAALEFKRQAGKGTPLSSTLQRDIDGFLTDLLDEYQLLRTPGQHTSLPPLANKQKTPTRSRKSQATKDYLV